MEGIEFVNLKRYVENIGRWPDKNDDIYYFYLEVRDDFFNTNGSPFEKDFFNLFCYLGELPTTDEWEKCNSEEKQIIYNSFKKKQKRDVTRDENPAIYDWVFEKNVEKEFTPYLMNFNIDELEKFVQVNNRWPYENEPLYQFYKNFRQYSFEYEFNENTEKFFNLFYHLASLPTDKEWEFCEKDIRKKIIYSYVKKNNTLPSHLENNKIYNWFHYIKHNKSEENFVNSVLSILKNKKQKRYSFIINEKPKPSTEDKSTQTFNRKILKRKRNDDFYLTCEIIKNSFNKYKKIPEVLNPWYNEQIKKHCNFQLDIEEIKKLKEIKQLFSSIQ